MKDSKILIVDDDEDICEIMADMFEDMVQSVQTVTDFNKTIEIIGKTNFDLIILDINLRGNNGAAIIQEIESKEAHPNKNTPIIICSGLIDQKFKSRYRYRFAGIFEKPFNPEKILGLAEFVIDNKDNELPTYRFDLPFSSPELGKKVSKVLKDVKENKKLSKVLKSLKVDRKEDNYIDEHINLLINVSSALAIQLEWSTDQTFEKLIYASYLHDITISDRPDLAKFQTRQEIENASNLHKADKEAAFNHPEHAGKVIDELANIPPEVDIIVRQHHERPDGSGFPMGVDHNRINALSTLFIVAHDFCDYIINTADWSVKGYCDQATEKFKGQHFRKVVYALSQVNV